VRFLRPFLHNNLAPLEFKDRINNTLFYSELTNWLDKLECYNTPGWKWFSETNPLAYWTHW
jgi:hypothetical protein